MDVSAQGCHAPGHVIRKEGGWGAGGRLYGLGLMSGDEPLSTGHCRVGVLQCCDSSPAPGPQAAGTAQSSTEAIALSSK